MRKFFARWYRTETMWRREFAMQILIATRRQDNQPVSAQMPRYNVTTGQIEMPHIPFARFTPYDLVYPPFL